MSYIPKQNFTPGSYINKSFNNVPAFMNSAIASLPAVAPTVYHTAAYLRAVIKTKAA